MADLEREFEELQKRVAELTQRVYRLETAAGVQRPAPAAPSLGDTTHLHRRQPDRPRGPSRLWQTYRHCCGRSLNGTSSRCWVASG
jgi:hypothetical protein